LKYFGVKLSVLEEKYAKNSFSKKFIGKKQKIAYENLTSYFINTCIYCIK